MLLSMNVIVKLEEISITSELHTKHVYNRYSAFEIMKLWKSSSEKINLKTRFDSSSGIGIISFLSSCRRHHHHHHTTVTNRYRNNVIATSALYDVSLGAFHPKSSFTFYVRGSFILYYVNSKQTSSFVEQKKKS